MEKFVIDEDTTDAFLDLPDLRYEPSGRTAAEIAKDAGHLPRVEPVTLPPLTDH
jgi:hypothetical protein